MIDALAGFHFLRPAWLVALALLPLLVVVLRRRGPGAGPWEAIVAPHLRPYVLDGAQAQRAGPRWPRRLLLLGCVLAVLALAGPVWRKLPQPVFRARSALVIALDLSRSMDAKDVAPSRLARAKLKLLDLLERRAEGQTALIVYAAEPFVVSPLTNDAATIAALVESLGTELMPAQGSRADRALALAGELLQRAGVARGDVLLLSDGVDWRDAEVATALRVQGLRVSVLGVGTAEGAPIPLAEGGLLEDTRGKILMARLDEAALRTLAARGGGAYSALRIDDGDLDALLPAGGASVGTQSEATSLSTDLWREEGPWLLLPLCLLGALAFRRGWVGVLLLTVLPWSAQALEWDALWSRDDQRGVAALAKGDAARAAELLEDPEWKASALYRAGRYDESASTLTAIDSARARYNRGNALARAGQLAQAIEAYERALELDPNDQDARENLELLRKQMRAQPQSQQGQQGQQGEQGQEDQQGQQGQQGDQSQQNPEDDRAAGSPQDAGGENDDAPAGAENEQTSPSQEDAGHASDEAQPQPEETRTPQQSAQARDAAAHDAADAKQAAHAAAQSTPEQDEAARAEAQWLRRIPDDPGGLLRRKFLYQYRQQRKSPEEEQQW